MKRILILLLTTMLVLSFTACGGNDTADKNNSGSSTGEKEQMMIIGELPNAIENTQYYFRQRYRTDWKIQQTDPDGYLVNEETNLVLQLVPVEVTKDEDGNVVEQGAVIEGVEYTVYAYKSTDTHHQNDAEKIAMTSTQQEVLSWLLDDKDETFYFNTHYYTDAPRDTFRIKSEPVIFTAKYTKLQFLRVSYTFTRDGENWSGILNFIMKGMDFFIITYEAKAELIDVYMVDFLQTIGDFQKVGWETAK